MTAPPIPALDPALFARLAALPAGGARHRFLAAHPQLRRAAAVEQLGAEVARLVCVDLAAAETFADAGRWLADALDDDRCRALAARAAANAAHFAGDSGRAQELYAQALAGFARLGEEHEAAITRSSALLNLAYLGDYERAFAWEAAAREVFGRTGDRLRLAILDHNLAAVLYRQDRWEEALVRYRFACDEFRRLERPDDVAVCLRNVAVCHISLHRFAEALAAYAETRAYAEAHGLARVVLAVDYNIAYLYYLRGEYTRAIALFQRARQQCEEQGDAYHQALCDLDQAEIYLELNLVEDAAGLARSAYAAFSRLKMPYETAKALTNEAIAASRQGRGAQALVLLEQARSIFEREGNPLWPALIDLYRAVVLYRERRPEEAIALAQGARAAFAATAAAPRAATCELLLAELYLATGATERARTLCGEALARLADLALPALEHQAYRVLGQVEEAGGDAAAALAAYEQALRRLEQLRSQLRGDDLKIAFLKDKQSVYESLVWLTLQGELTPERSRRAFTVIEKAKSRALTDLLAASGASLPPAAGAQSELAARARTLREELSWLYRQLDLRQLEGSGDRVSEEERLRQSAAAKEDELLRALRELQAGDRELGALQGGTEVDLEAVRGSLPAGAALVEYFVARGTVFACVVDRERLEITAVTSAARARELLRLLQFQLARARPGREATAGGAALVNAATQSHLGDLYRELVAPLAASLRGERLIVVPHGFLHYLPFHALRDGDGYLSERFAVSYAPSASVFHLCASKERRWEERSLVLGVADERAPDIGAEVRAVAEALPRPTLLLGAAASEEALRAHAPGCRYVHVATHGLFRRDNPMFSALQLGTSRLSLYDLYDLRLDAELVVLSGCGTGLNAVLGADELLGLTRGLLYAGAHSVLVTLWDVHDASTARFMRRFYHHLTAGESRVRALGRAMDDLRAEYPSPYYWAPFVLIGEAE